MSRLITKKPVDDQKLKFKPMGSKPSSTKAVPAKKKKAKKARTSPFAKRAAMALAKGE